MILDEIRKLRFNHTSMESINSKGIAKVCYEPVVKLSDIEKLLEDVRCENCKKFKFDDDITSASREEYYCDKNEFYFDDFRIKIQDFYCSQFERKP